MVLGTGDDNVTLEEGLQPIAIGQLRVDYRDNSPLDGFDYRTNRLLDVTLLNFQGYDIFQSVALNQVNFVEKASHSWVGFGTGADGRALLVPLQASGVAMSEVANLRLTTLSNSGDIAVITESPLEGFVIINARQGNRRIDIGPPSLGVNETFVGDVLRIDASGGDQTVSVNNRLLADRLSVNLRDGNDVVRFVDNSGGAPSFIGDMMFRGVNTVFQQNGAQVAVFGDVVINTKFFVETSSFVNTDPMYVQGKFTYLGGDGWDMVKLADFHAGEIYVDLGKNTVSGSGSQDFRVTGPNVDVGYFPYSNGNFFVKAGNAALNVVDLQGAPKIRGYANVDLSKNTTGQNIMFLQGVFYDRFVYVGGPVKDVISMFGATQHGKPLKVFLGAGADQFGLQNTSHYFLDELFIDFGAGIDSFIDGFAGTYPFVLTTVNLP